jgi:HK97 family phage portal protein
MVAYGGAGQPRSTPRNFEQLAREGYQNSVIAYRCINLIARSVGAVTWCLHGGDGDSAKEIEKHPLLDLLKRPNPMQGGARFFEALAAYYLISGNSYIDAVQVNGKPGEMWVLRPDRMKVIPGTTGLPQGYRYTAGGQHRDYKTDALTGTSPELLHVKSFHPLDDWYGMSPLEAAAFALDQHNEAGVWNARMLRNSARPSGALVYSPKGDDAPDTMTEQQRASIRAELDSYASGSSNAGRPLILEGGLDWREMSLSPKDMEWLQGKDVSAREVALAYHVPAQLVGIAGSQTFANFEQARLALYDDAVLPIVDMLKDEMNNWLCPQFGDGIRLEYDMDSIPALEPRRKEKWEAIKTADFLTVNEKRIAMGYAPVKSADGDLILVGAGLIPLESASDGGEPDETDAAAAGADAYGDIDGDPDDEQPA